MATTGRSPIYRLLGSAFVAVDWWRDGRAVRLACSGALGDTSSPAFTAARTVSALRVSKHAALVNTPRCKTCGEREESHVLRVARFAFTFTVCAPGMRGCPLISTRAGIFRYVSAPPYRCKNAYSTTRVVAEIIPTNHEYTTVCFHQLHRIAS